MEATWVEKYINLRVEKKRRLIHAVVEDTSAYRQIVEALKRQEQVMELFNIDLLHLQQYLFTGLQIEPTSNVTFLHDSNGLLSEIRKVDEYSPISLW